MSLYVAVVTVSDRCSRHEAEDSSGPEVIKVIQSYFNSQDAASARSRTAPCTSDSVQAFEDVHFLRYVVPDDVGHIQDVIRLLTDIGSARYTNNPLAPRPQLMITTGGTGLGPRDVTPEALKPLFSAEVPSIVQKMQSSSMTTCPHAWLSRAVAGVVGGLERSLVIALPGSTKAVKECLVPLLDTGLLHAVRLVSTLTHSTVLSTPPSSGVSKAMVPSAERVRESPYPMVPMDEAYRLLFEEAATSMLGTRAVRLPQALHCVTAEPIVTSFPHPPFRASVKDGYAVCSDEGTGEFLIAGASLAGGVPEKERPSPRTVWRVNTGGMVPDWADAVVQVEDTALVASDAKGEECRIAIQKAAAPGQDIRPVGCDMPAEKEVVAKGSYLTAAEVGIAASIGVQTLRVYQKPSVAVFSTGDELVDGGDYAEGAIPMGSIVDSNKPMLLAALRELRYGEVGAVEDMGVVRDSFEGTKKKIQDCLLAADVVVSSGGVSMGDVDHIKQALLDLGGVIHFGRVNMKPGKPTTFATFTDGGRKKYFFGLPGNPVSALVCFHLFVAPFLRRLCRLPSELLPEPVLTARLVDTVVRLDGERPEYRRCVVRKVSPGSASDSEGAVHFEAESCGGQASSRLLSLHKANGLMMLPREEGGTRKKGDIVSVLVLSNIL